MIRENPPGPIIFAINGAWNHYQLSPKFYGLLFDPTSSKAGWTHQILPAPCCPLPGRLPEFDREGELEVDEVWQPVVSRGRG